MTFNDESGYKMADALQVEELNQWNAAIDSRDWDTVRCIERVARKRYGGGLPADDGVFTRS